MTTAVLPVRIKQEPPDSPPPAASRFTDDYCDDDVLEMRLATHRHPVKDEPSPTPLPASSSSSSSSTSESDGRDSGSSIAPLVGAPPPPLLRPATTTTPLTPVPVPAVPTSAERLERQQRMLASMHAAMSPALTAACASSQPPGASALIEMASHVTALNQRVRSAANNQRALPSAVSSLLHELVDSVLQLTAENLRLMQRAQKRTHLLLGAAVREHDRREPPYISNGSAWLWPGSAAAAAALGPPPPPPPSSSSSSSSQPSGAAQSQTQQQQQQQPQQLPISAAQPHNTHHKSDGMHDIVAAPKKKGGSRLAKGRARVATTAAGAAGAAKPKARPQSTPAILFSRTKRPAT